MEREQANMQWRAAESDECLMVVEIVKFRSALSAEEVRRTMRTRMSDYRALRGLLQKLYIHDSATGEHGGIYLWRNETALADFRESELARSIAPAYQIEGRPQIQHWNVISVL
jgi:hypothetical protein